jgi:hypothetical protein
MFRKMNMKVQNSSLFVIILFLLSGCGSQAQRSSTQPEKDPAVPSVAIGNSGQWQEAPDGSLSFRISTEKKTYNVSERVTVRAELKNNSKADVSILPVHVAFGNVGDAIRIFGPQEVKYRGPFKSMPPPKKIVLSAGITTTAEAPIDDRYDGFGVGGEYKITCSFSGMTSTVVITLMDKKD